MGVPAQGVDEMLDLAGLTSEEATRRVGDYSLGCGSGSASRTRVRDTPG